MRTAASTGSGAAYETISLPLPDRISVFPSPSLTTVNLPLSMREGMKRMSVVKDQAGMKLLMEISLSSNSSSKTVGDFF